MIRINNAMSVWQLATTLAAIFVQYTSNSRGFTFVAGWAIQLYIDQWFKLNRVFISEVIFQIRVRSVLNVALFMRRT